MNGAESRDLVGIRGPGLSICMCRPAHAGYGPASLQFALHAHAVDAGLCGGADHAASAAVGVVVEHADAGVVALDEPDGVDFSEDAEARRS
jgi:hypothetical protein